MSRKQGSVLIVTLLATALLSSVAIAQATHVSLELKWANRLQESRQAWALAWTGVQAAAQELALDPTPNWDAPKENWGQVSQDPIHLPKGKFQVRILDEQARIPLNSASLELVAQLPGFSISSANALISRRKEGKALAHLGELLLLDGFQAAALPELEPLVTLYGNGPVNVNTASAAVLTRLGCSTALASQIVQFRAGADGRWGTADDEIFPDVAQIAPLMETQFGPLLPEDQTTLGNLISSQQIGVRSSFFQVEAEGWTDAHGIYQKVIAVMERSEPNSKPEVRGWYEA